MKIAIIVTSFPSLSESFIVRQIVGLLEQGHEIRIFAFSKSSQKEVQKEVRDFRLVEKTTFISLPRKKWRLRIKGLGVLIACILLNPKVTCHLLLSFKKAAEFSYSSLFLTFFFLKERFDLVHAHFGPNGLQSLCLKKNNSKIKHLTTFHGYDVTVYVRQKGNDCYNELFRIGDRFTYNSESTKQKLLLLGCPEGKMEKLPMGIDTDNILFKERHLGTGETVRLLSVGRLVEMKGREYAIRAAARLAEHYKLHYDIVGDGPLRDELQSLVEELKAGEYIKIWGWVSSEKLQHFYQQAHLFIHPSIISSDGNEEGQGVVLLEAQAYGIPVIATKHGAFPDSVLDGQSGVLVAEKDVNVLADAIERLIINAPLWPQMGKAGRRFVESTFKTESLILQMINVYTQLIHNKNTI
jgi:colanic acid/amylovoran biosynthesis glycosyltransferase